MPQYQPPKECQVPEESHSQSESFPSRTKTSAEPVLGSTEALTSETSFGPPRLRRLAPRNCTTWPVRVPMPVLRSVAYQSRSVQLSPPEGCWMLMALLSVDGTKRDSSCSSWGRKERGLLADEGLLFGTCRNQFRKRFMVSSFSGNRRVEHEPRPSPWCLDRRCHNDAS